MPQAACSDRWIENGMSYTAIIGGDLRRSTQLTNARLPTDAERVDEMNHTQHLTRQFSTRIDPLIDAELSAVPVSHVTLCHVGDLVVQYVSCFLEFICLLHLCAGISDPTGPVRLLSDSVKAQFLSEADK